MTEDARHARTLLPAHVHRGLRRLGADLDRPLTELLVEGAILLLRFHGRAEGLPAPEPSVATALETREGQR